MKGITIIAILLISFPLGLSCHCNMEYSSRDFSLFDSSRNRSIPTTVYYPINGKNFPVIIVSHGGGGNRTSLISHVKHLVSNGYVVIVPEHVGSNKDYLEYLMSKGYSFWQALKQMAGNTTEWENRPKDISFLIDMAYEWNNSDEDLKGKMNLNKIGILGHSYGAYTAMAIMGALVNMPYGMTNFGDARVKAALAISPQGAGGNPQLDRINNCFTKDSWRNITKPISFHVESDTLIEWRKELFNTLPLGDKYFLRFVGSKHADFADWLENLRSMETKNVSKALALRFFDIYLKGEDKVYNEEYADSLCISNKIVTDIVWNDRLQTDGPILSIEKPLIGYLYIFDRMIMSLSSNTIIFGKITIEVNAYDDDGIYGIEFYIDDKLKAVDNSTPYSWQWNEFAIGKHEIKVIAYDIDGKKVSDKIDVWKII